eukprot:4389845-Alexandrium_andersonii.AAC.1
MSASLVGSEMCIRDSSCAWQCGRPGVSDFRRFRPVERAVWLVGRAGTAAPCGWILGPELTLPSH